MKGTGAQEIADVVPAGLSSEEVQVAGHTNTGHIETM